MEQIMRLIDSSRSWYSMIENVLVLGPLLLPRVLSLLYPWELQMA